MKYILITIVMLSISNDPMKIGKINSAKADARKAYTSGDYKTAVAKYRYLIDSLQVTEDEVTLNLANSYFQLKDTANAFSTYQSLTGSTKNVVRSKAQQQIGIMNHQKGKLEEALNNFKQSIKADPNNMDARYNYELLKKKLDEKKKQEQQKQDQNKDKKDQNKDQKDQQKKDQEKKDQEKKDQEQKDQEKKDQEKKEQEQKNQQNKDQKDKKDQEQKEQQKKEDAKKDQQNKEQQDQQNKDQEQNADKKQQQQDISKKLEQMKISKEKANALLEAMRTQEFQYLQENRRKATKPKDRTKPDW